MSGGQRVVLKVEINEDGDMTIPLSDLRALVRLADKHELDPKFRFDVYADGDSFRIMGSLPPGEWMVNGRRVLIRRKSRHERAVEAQIRKHRKKKEKGDTTENGHVKPVSYRDRTVTKIVCPDCGHTKKVQKINNMRTIKPHVVHGEPCPGSGKQV